MVFASAVKVDVYEIKKFGKMFKDWMKSAASFLTDLEPPVNTPRWSVHIVQGVVFLKNRRDDMRK